MVTPRTSSRFRTTSWTQIRRARDSEEGLLDLLSDYWSPIYAYLRQHGRNQHDAADLTQGFVADVVLGRGLVGRADERLGRFRTYLLTCLQNYTHDKFREERGRNRPRPILLSIDNEALAMIRISEADDPSKAFERQWATRTLEIAVRRCEVDCRESGLDSHWRAFEDRVLRPALDGTPAPPLNEIAQAVGVESPEKVSSIVNTVKRKLRSHLADAVAETVESASEIDEELAALRGYLT